jgi:hypothetical protein
MRIMTGDRLRGLRCRTFLRAVLAFASLPALTAAETMAPDIALSYGSWHEHGATDPLHGASLALSIPMGQRLRAVIEATHSAETTEFAGISPEYDMIAERATSLLGGLRYSFGDGRIRPYAELLAGAVWRSDRTRLYGNPSAWSGNNLELQPALGVDLMLTRRVGIRAGAEFPTVVSGFRGDAEEAILPINANTTHRLHVGLVVCVGALGRHEH